jgi:hypothetical protein
LSVKPSRAIAYLLVPLLAVLITWITGFWGRGIYGGISDYGFPFPWKTVEFLPVCNLCPEPTSYNWGFFLLDVVLYAAIGYGILFCYMKLAGKQKIHVVEPGRGSQLPKESGQVLFKTKLAGRK